MKALVCSMCDWSALVAMDLDSRDGQWAARRILDMHFDTHVADFRDELTAIAES